MEIQNALLNSHAYQSLSIEAEIFDIIKRYFPHASRSPYFLDNTTNKLREIDIMADARFQKNKKNSTFCNINFLIECKTNKGYNIIVDGIHNKKDHYLYDWQVWVGDDANERLEKSRIILSKSNLNIDAINSDLKELNNLFYPKERKRTRQVELKAFSDIDSFSSFRETNTKDEKDLDNSVLWRAFQALSSAQIAFTKNVWEYYEKDLLLYTESKINPHVEYRFAIKDLIDMHAQNIDLIQKIIVIDSPLWKKIGNEKIEPVKYFRLIRTRIDSIYIDFVDVVNRAHFTEYIEALNKYYLKFQKAKRLIRVY